MSTEILSEKSPEQKQSRRGPFGFWLTTAFAIFIVIVWGIAQSLVLVAYGILSTGSLDMQDLSNLERDGFFLGIVTVSTTPIALGLTAFFAWIRRIPLREYFAWQSVRPRVLILWCVLGVLVALGADLAKYLLDLPMVSDFVVDSYRTARFMPLYVLAIVVCAPLWEEVLFRGFIFAGYAQSPVRVAGAILIPAIIWALIHMQYEVHDIVTIFVLGLVIGLARWRTASLITPIAMHMLLNGIAVASVAIEHYSGTL